jgi:hypothetical protein
MDDQALSTLIPAAAGLLGALIGFLGSQITHKRSVGLAREQRRFERAQEMQAEVIPKLFVRLRTIAELFSGRLDAPLRLTEAVGELLGERLDGRLNDEQAEARLAEWSQEFLEREFGALSKKATELNEYFILHRIWLPQDLARAFEELLDKYNQNLGDASRASRGLTAKCAELIDSKMRKL